MMRTSKEKRDTFLLIFMAIIFILFLVYLFVPFGGGNEQKNSGKTGDKTKEGQTKDPQNVKLGNTSRENLNNLKKRISSELIKIYTQTKETGKTLIDYDIRLLKQIFTDADQPETDDNNKSKFEKQLKKISSLGFYDLGQMASFEYPRKVEKSLIFDIFISFFLIKAVEENINNDVADLSDTVFKKVVNLDAYGLISSEIEKDYQAIPVLFFFKLILDRCTLYPIEDDFSFFREKLDSIRDLSEGKIITKIKDLISFSLSSEKYRIEWTEKDGLVDPDDRETYNNVGLRTIHFLKQIFLVFPDYNDENSNRWIKELISADTGGIELVGFQISNEDPNKNLQIKKIFYRPQKSQFIVLLRGNNLRAAENFLDKAVFQRMIDFHQNFLTVDFELRFIDQKSFKRELGNFGKYLKKQVSVK